jgi:hypothetical protein
MRYLGAVSRYLDLSRYFDVSPSITIYFAAGPNVADAQDAASTDGGYVVDLATSASVTIDAPGTPQNVTSSILATFAGTGASSDLHVATDLDPVGSSLVIGSGIIGASSWVVGGAPARQFTISFESGAGSVTAGWASVVLVCR